MQHHIRGHTPGAIKLVGHLRINPKFLGETHCRIRHTRLKLLVLAFVLTHLHIPVDQLGGKSCILTTSSDGLAQVFLVHRYVDDLVLFVEIDRTDLGGLKRIRYECVGFVAPANDVHFLIVQFSNNVLHPRTA